MDRIHSPSSINLYKKCARKYYLRYVKGIPLLPNVYMVRGTILHSVLEKFFDTDLKGINFENYETTFKARLQELALKAWQENKKLLDSFILTDDEIKSYFNQIIMMALNWFDLFNHRIKLFSQDLFENAFEKLKPVREKRYYSPYYRVQGYIDAVENLNGSVRIMDYKTSSDVKISEEYKLQLAIYALLYFEEHGKLPDKVGIYFVRADGISEELIQVGQELLDYAKNEILEIKEKTLSEKEDDYPKTKEFNRNCRWGSGQCEYYEMCFGQKKLADFNALDKPIVQEEDFGVF